MTADISRYVTNMTGNVYALKELPEEVVAFLFARYSRSSLSLRDDLRGMIEAEDMGALIGNTPPQTENGGSFGPMQERARAFAEKYVLGYGHGSVAEHGCVHLALEDISILASKLIEDARLASFTEKSTRYVAFDPSKIYHPPGVMAHPALARVYTEAIRGLLDAYTGWTADFIGQIKARAPRTEKQTERGYEAASKATAFDTLRYLLPAATSTNIGLTVNARALEGLITKLLSQPLAEGRALGAQMKQEARHIVPTLLKYADHNAGRAETEAGMAALASALWDAPPVAEAPGPPVVLVSVDPDADATLVASMLYGHAGLPMDVLLPRVRVLDRAAQERVVDAYLSGRGKHDQPGRALERVFCTMELTMDYGAYRDVQRHRMATQTMQPLSPALGYETPPLVEAFGYAEPYHALMAQARAAYAAIADAGLAEDAPYALPLATRCRTLFTWNLREVAHFVELRSARQGHPSYRRIAQGVYYALADALPLFARYLRPNLNDYALTRD